MVTKSEYLTIRVSANNKRFIKKLATDQQRTVSWIANQIIVCGLMSKEWERLQKLPKSGKAANLNSEKRKLQGSDAIAQRPNGGGSRVAPALPEGKR